MPLWRWYVPGAAAILLTNYLSVRIPIEMAAGLDALRAGGTDGVRSAAIHIALLGAATIVIRTLSRIAFFTPGRLAEFQLREDLFGRLLRLQPDFYSRYPTGDLLSRATSDVTQARAFAGFATLQAINVVAGLVMGLGQMLWMSPLLTVVSVLPVVLSFGVLQLGIRTLMRLQRAAQAQLATLADDLLGTIHGVGTIQSFCAEPTFVGRLTQRADALRTTNIALARLRAWIFPLLLTSGGVSVFLLLAVGGPRAIAGEISAGQLAAFISLLAYLLFPLLFLGILVSAIQRAEASLERVYTVLDAPVTRPEIGQVQPYPRPGHGPTIELRGLSFAYSADTQPVLKDLSVTLRAGTTVGIFGRTGTGKTTLLRVLSRLNNPPRGTVFIDGTDILDLDLDDWRRRMTLVPQVPFLFGETIAENVGFGASEADVRDAVAAAALLPDLASLQDGLKTVVGERGIVLSGGQRQRVALARGLRRSTELVMLDDVLSAVDHHTEQELIATLRARKVAGAGAPTRILVSHRMSALADCDQVLVLDEGRLVDVGTHAELLARAGFYQEAWQAQQGAGT